MTIKLSAKVRFFSQVNSPKYREVLENKSNLPEWLIYRMIEAKERGEWLSDSELFSVELLSESVEDGVDKTVTATDYQWQLLKSKKA